jgi:polyisoprenoid-binding protein YceI
MRSSPIRQSLRANAARLPILLLLLWATTAGAADWKTLPGSTLGFSASFQGEAFEGRFGKFTPQIRFDPAQLGQSRFDVSIDLTSANTSNQERDDTLRGPEFFNAKKQPQAHFLATKFRAAGGNRYIADGVLTLNGVSKPVPLSFTWTTGAKTELTGEATLKRLDFSVGTGDWTDTDLLPNQVKVKTRLLLGPVKK